MAVPPSLSYASPEPEQILVLQESQKKKNRPKKRLILEGTEKLLLGSVFLGALLFYLAVVFLSFDLWFEDTNPYQQQFSYDSISNEVQKTLNCLPSLPLFRLKSYDQLRRKWNLKAAIKRRPHVMQTSGGEGVEGGVGIGGSEKGMKSYLKDVKAKLGQKVKQWCERKKTVQIVSDPLNYWRKLFLTCRDQSNKISKSGRLYKALYTPSNWKKFWACEEYMDQLARMYNSHLWKDFLFYCGPEATLPFFQKLIEKRGSNLQIAQNIFHLSGNDPRYNYASSVLYMSHKREIDNFFLYLYFNRNNPEITIRCSTEALEYVLQVNRIRGPSNEHSAVCEAERDICSLLSCFARPWRFGYSTRKSSFVLPPPLIYLIGTFFTGKEERNLNFDLFS